MKKAPSPFAAMLMLAVFLSAELSLGGPPQCSFCVCGIDAECSELDDCVGMTECDATPFTAPCTGTFGFASKVICYDGRDDCAQCQSCATIYTDTGQYVGNAHNTHCDTDDCSYPSTVKLTGGQNYVLYVCKMTCNSEASCDACGESCKAFGCIWANVVYPCLPL